MLLKHHNIITENTQDKYSFWDFLKIKLNYFFLISACNY